MENDVRFLFVSARIQVIEEEKLPTRQQVKLLPLVYKENDNNLWTFTTATFNILL